MLNDKYKVFTFLEKDYRTLYNANTNEIITYNDKKSEDFKIKILPFQKKEAYEKELELREASPVLIYSNYWTLISGAVSKKENWQTAVYNIDTNIKQELKKSNKTNNLIGKLRNFFNIKNMNFTSSLEELADLPQKEGKETDAVYDMKPQLYEDPNQLSLFDKPKHVDKPKVKKPLVSEDKQKEILDLLIYAILLDYDDFKNRAFIENKYYSIEKTKTSNEKSSKKLLLKGSFIDIFAMLIEKNMYFGGSIPQVSQLLKSKYNTKILEINPEEEISEHIVRGIVKLKEEKDSSNRINMKQYYFQDEPITSRDYLKPLKSKEEFLKHISVMDEIKDNNLSIVREYTNLSNGYAVQEVYLIRTLIKEPFKYNEKTPIKEIADILFT